MLVALLFVISATTVSAVNTHHTVYGYITDYDSGTTNGRTVTVKNVDNLETISTTTYGTTTAGKYQVDLGNMATQWVAGDEIEVKCSYTSSGKIYTGVETFTISSGDTITQQDVTIDQWAYANPTSPPDGASDPDITNTPISTNMMNVLIAIMIFVVIAAMVLLSKGGRKK